MGGLIAAYKATACGVAAAWGLVADGKIDFNTGIELSWVWCVRVCVYMYLWVSVCVEVYVRKHRKGERYAKP